MKHDFEYMNQSDSERLAMLESRAAELERRLGEVTPEYGIPEYPAPDYGPMEFAAVGTPQGGTGHGRHEAGAGHDAAATERHADGYPVPGGYPDAGADGYPDAGVGGPDERTEVLINRGRRHARRRGLGRWLAHWRAIAIGVAAVVLGVILLAVILPGNGASWPASVARVQSEITVA